VVLLPSYHGVDKEALVGGGLANNVTVVLGGSSTTPETIETVFNILQEDPPLHDLFSSIARGD